jgi:hypothetical protein
MRRAFVIARRVFAIVAVVAMASLAVLLHSQIESFIGTHPWWQDSLAFLATVALPILAYFELRHSAEANKLCDEANDLRKRANGIQDEANEQRKEANKFRDEANEQRKEANLQRDRANEALARIAENTKRVQTKTERNSAKLQKYLRCKVQVINADDSRWGDAAEIVEIKDDVVTLFTPCSHISSSAFEVHVHCDNLEIIEGLVGSLPLSLKVLKRYGTDRNLGEIKTWEQRTQQLATPAFSRGPNVFGAEYIKTGSPEQRRLDVFESADGANFYMLVASPGETVYGDNKEISRKFMLVQMENQIQGFRWNGGRTGGSKHVLYINTRP